MGIMANAWGNRSSFPQVRANLMPKSFWNG
jgi:hypothetical protein